MGVCKCSQGLVNTGIGNCEPLMRVAEGIYMMQTYSDSGVRNFLDLTVPLDDIALKAKINEPDKSKRWYPIMGLKNVQITDEDTVFSTAGDGSKSFVRDGIRSVTAEIRNINETYIGRMRGNRCPQISIFIIDGAGKMSGIFRGGDETKLYPFDIARGSFDAKFNSATDSDTTIGMIMFDFTKTDIANMQNFRILTEDTATANLLDVEGLVDIKLVVVAGSITATGFDFDAYAINGGTQKQPLKGLVQLDAKLTELPSTTDLITGFAESVSIAGRYTVTFASNPSSSLTLKITKERFDIEQLKITTP